MNTNNDEVANSDFQTNAVNEVVEYEVQMNGPNSHADLANEHHDPSETIAKLNQDKQALENENAELKKENQSLK